jgi:hypothetical protein
MKRNFLALFSLITLALVPLAAHAVTGTLTSLSYKTILVLGSGESGSVRLNLLTRRGRRSATLLTKTCRNSWPFTCSDFTYSVSSNTGSELYELFDDPYFYRKSMVVRLKVNERGTKVRYVTERYPRSAPIPKRTKYKDSGRGIPD